MTSTDVGQFPSCETAGMWKVHLLMASIHLTASSMNLPVLKMLKELDF